MKSIYCEWKTNGRVKINRDEKYIASYGYDRISLELWEMLMRKYK